jgi:hypothetical protein
MGFTMRTSSSALGGAAHQTVAAPIQLRTGAKSIQIGFTDQRLSPYAGSATFWSWLLASNWRATLQAALPHPPAQSNNHLAALDKALAFVQGVLVDARKLTHVAYLRRDPLVPELLGIRRVASQSSLSRFFQGFRSAAVNLRCFRSLWQWGIAQLPSRPEGYTLDLDSTRLLHEDGQQEGVAIGYTRRGLKPCLNPLLAVVAEVRLVAQLWLRAGNTACGNNAGAFFLDLWEQRPRHVRWRGVRADAGFCLPELLALWERLRLPYVVVAQLSQPIQRLLRGDLVWTATDVPGTEVAEREYQALGWPHARRLVLIRHRVGAGDRRGGKKLLDVPGYHFQALVTSLSPHLGPLAVWRYYNGRADCENVIKELQQGFALPSLCLRSFWATEAALSLAALTYNLTVLFQRHLGWQQKVTIQSLRYWLFMTAGVLSHPAGRTTVKLAVPLRERGWWRRLWEKILSPIPNCHAVENRPAFSG